MDMMTYLADVLVAPSPPSIVRSSYTFILGLLILFPVQESIGSNVSDFQEEQLQKYPFAYSAVGLQGEAMPTALTENTAEAQGKSLLLKVYSSSAIPQDVRYVNLETTTGGTYVAQWGPSASAGTNSFEFSSSFAVLQSIPTQKSAVSSESTVFQPHLFPESQPQSHTLEAKEIKSVLLTSASALTDIMSSLMKSIKSTSDSVALLTVPSTSSSDSKSSVLETVFLSPSGLSKLVPPTLIVPTSSFPSFPSHLTTLHDMSQDHSVQSVSQWNTAILPSKETTAQGLSQSSIDLSNIHSALISGVHEPVMSTLDIFKTSEMFVSLLTSTSHSTSTLLHASNLYPSSLASHAFTFPFPSQDELKDSSAQLKSVLITANGDLNSVFHYSDVKHVSLKGTSTLPDIFTSVINVPSRQSQVEYLTAFNSPVPSVRPYIVSLTLDVTPVYQDGFSLSYSMEHDPGSGDYLETVSIVASQKKALTSSLTFLTDIYDPYDSNLEILDTSFPSRPLVSHSSFFDNFFTFSLDSVSTFKTGLNTVLPATLDPLYIQSSMSHSFVKFSDDASNYPVYMTKSDLELEDSYLDFSDATSHYVVLATKLPISKQQPNVTGLGLPLNSETRKSESKSEETDALSVPESTSVMQELSMEDSFAPDVFLHKTSSFSLDILPSHLPTVWFSDSSDKTPLPSQVYSKESTQFSVLPIFPSTILPWKLDSLELDESSIMPDNFATVDGTNIDASDFIPLSSSNSLLTTVFVSDIPPVGSSETQFYSDVSVLSKEALDSQLISEQSFTSGVLRATSLMEALPTYSPATVLPATAYPLVSSHLKEENSTELLNTRQQTPQRTESVFSHIKSDISLISSTVSQSLHLVEMTSTSHFNTHMASSSSLYVSVSPTPTGPVFMVSSFSKTATTSAPNTSLIEVTNLTNAVSTMTDKAVTDVYSTNNMNLTTVTQITGFPSAANRTTAATASSTTVTTIAATASTTTTQPYLCDITVPDVYLVKAVLSEDAVLSINEAIKNQLQFQFNRTVELQIHKTSPELTFLVTSGPLVYTAESVINALSNSSLLHGEPPKILSLQRVITVPDYKFQAHTVLQFVPGNMDVRFCNFSRQIERGLMMAFAAARRRYRQMVNISVQVLNVTMHMSDPERLRKGPVNITFAINDQSTFILGADVSDLLRLLSLVEFSFYLGFPVLQVAEPFHYPELNVSHILRSSWIRTVLLGVLDSRVREKVFHAEMERKFAQLFSEAVVQKRRRLKRATTVGNVTVQVVNVSRIDDTDYPVEVVYFVEGQSGERLSAVEAASLINKVDIQKAAIILGYRVKGSLAQPVNKIEESPSENHNSNLWIIVGVVVPVIVVVTIIFILYWKLCRTDRLEFQPDTMSNIQQRQKTPGAGLQSLILCSLQKQQPQHSLQKQQQQQETQPLGCQLQAPSVKGFDFAKQHLGQQNKDDVLVLQEPASLPTPVKDAAVSENGDVPSPKSRTPSKPSKGVRHRGRITPSDAESTTSEQSSGRETPEETPRHSVTTGESKQHRAVKNGPPQVNGVDEQTSSASIFDHVDRISRSSEASRRITNKIQLIAMQPIPTPPLQNAALPERVTETAKINKEIQTALRHKSEIEHHRNKIRLRAKRKGHYDFPVMDDDGIQDPKDRRKIYRKAQMQFDKILEPGMNMPTVHIEARRSSRAKRSPKQRRKHQMNGSLTDAEKDRLITTDSDGTYKRPPGVNNVAYISDPDVPLESQSPSPSDPAMYPSSPLNQPPPPYVPPQPSIEEARQQMHSLLDDAFALVAPTSQGNNVASTTALPGATIGQPVTSTPSRTTRATSCTQWTAPYGPVQPANIPFARYTDLGMASPAAPTVLQRQGYGPGFLPPTELIRQEQSQPETPYPNRGIYPEDIPAVARPRPVGSTTGSQIHQLTQVGITNRTGAQTADIPSGRAGLGQHLGPPGWSPYRTDEDFIRSGMQKDGTHVLGHQDYVSPPMYQIPRTSGRDPTAPPSHLQPSNLQGTGTCYNAEDIQRGHSSASLIKAIREELLRLSQKQSVIQDFHS